MRPIAVLLAIAIAVLGADGHKVTNYQEDRTTMVHLFEWKWNDIAKECEDFLAPRGYAAVQTPRSSIYLPNSWIIVNPQKFSRSKVSPIQENVVIGKRPWYERYQPISYEWSTRSGTEEEFRSMVKRCNQVGVRIYVDILLNHMSGNHENARGTGGSKADTFELHYPGVPYNRTNFHKICSVNNYQDAENVRNCELVGLHDLDQSQEYVRDKIATMLNKAVDAGVAGFRVDAAKHMYPKDLEIIYSRVKNLSVEHGFPSNSRPFIFQEVIDYGGEAVSKYEYNELAAVTEFKFGSELSNAFVGRNKLKWLANWGEAWGLLPRSDALVFIDNHDTQRSNGDTPITYKNSKLYKMAVAFMLAHPYGIPRVMSSFEFSDFENGPPADSKGNIISPKINEDNTCGNGWVCEHRWRQIYNMVGFRNYVRDEPDVSFWWDNGNYQISFCRGKKGFIAINADKVDLKQKLTVCLPAGVYCDIISGELGQDGKCTGKSVHVDGKGQADVVIGVGEDDGVLAIHGGARAS
ncbi:hypothetical protein TSAR_000075 [Trichomalopsis sarcophagae]|uniref:Alpha-amylase n=1 Tax=Trichomalopsis sarcophagae TaxID=543379 RepID=A0A232F1R4_9HYME|nr:hypothetical protein TSAR_000075 [Trichomalopsis sarcophagae]